MNWKFEKRYNILAILLKKFQFSPKNSKMNWKFEKRFPSVCRAHQDQSIEVYH